MNYSGPYRYQLILSGAEDKRQIVAKLKEGRHTKFVPPLTKNKRPKIYVIKVDKEVVYIGYTSQSITSRLNYGLKAKGKNGYHGYKWKNASDEVELLVFVFERELAGDIEKDRGTINFVEAIEAELVFKHRAEKGYWPKYQNEIHFNNEQLKSVLGITECIYNYITE